MRFAAAGLFGGYVCIQGSLSRESSQLHESSQVMAIADVATHRVVGSVVDEPGGDALQGANSCVTPSSRPLPPSVTSSSSVSTAWERRKELADY